MLGTGLVTAHLKLLQRALLQKNGSIQLNSTHILFQMVCSFFNFFSKWCNNVFINNILCTGTTVADNCTGVDQVRTSQSTKDEACQSMLMYCRILIVTVLQWIVLSSTRARGASVYRNSTGKCEPVERCNTRSSKDGITVTGVRQVDYTHYTCALKLTKRWCMINCHVFVGAVRFFFKYCTSVKF